MTTYNTDESPKLVKRPSQVMLGDASDNWEVVRETPGEPDDILAVVQTETMAATLISLLMLSSGDKAVLRGLFPEGRNKSDPTKGSESW